MPCCFSFFKPQWRLKEIDFDTSFNIQLFPIFVACYLGISELQEVTGMTKWLDCKTIKESNNFNIQDIITFKIYLLSSCIRGSSQWAADKRDVSKRVKGLSQSTCLKQDLLGITVLCHQYTSSQTCFVLTKVGNLL